MTMFNAIRDFADGLTRGLSLFVTERNDFTVRTTTPFATPPRRRKVNS